MNEKSKTQVSLTYFVLFFSSSQTRMVFFFPIFPPQNFFPKTQQNSSKKLTFIRWDQCQNILLKSDVRRWRNRCLLTELVKSFDFFVFEYEDSVFAVPTHLPALPISFVRFAEAIIVRSPPHGLNLTEVVDGRRSSIHWISLRGNNACWVELYGMH